MRSIAMILLSSLMMCTIGIDGSGNREQGRRAHIPCATGWAREQGSPHVAFSSPPNMRLRGGEEVREGKISKSKSKSKSGSTRKEKCNQNKEDSKTRVHIGAAVTEEQEGKQGDEGGQVDLDDSVAGNGDGVVGAGRSENAEQVQADREVGEEVAEEGGPNLMFGDFATDFPNRERIDELYQGAEIYREEQENQESSELEEESSGDKQGNNPFEVCLV